MKGYDVIQLRAKNWEREFVWEDEEFGFGQAFKIMTGGSSRNGLGNWLNENERLVFYNIRTHSCQQVFIEAL